MMNRFANSFFMRMSVVALFAVSSLIGVFAAPVPAQAAVQEVLYASPDGSGSVCSQAAPCSLEGARDKVRTINGSMSGDIVVYLRGGTYALTEPFRLTENGSIRDSGTNGYFVVYQAYENETPVLSGGMPVTGWTLHDSQLNMYKAYVGTAANTRQFYVDGVRADRARGPDNPAGFTETSTGYATANVEMQTWGNPNDIEFVYEDQWTQSRCGVSAISGTTITMKQPCFDYANGKRGMPIDAVKRVENAYELLDSPGEWYLNRSTGYLFYIPRPGENLSTAQAVIPVLETLMEGQGTLDHPLHHVRFQGLTFAYATWLRPSGNEGFAEIQAAFTVNAADPTALDSKNDVKIPANVTFSSAHNIVFERNVFKSLGASGLNFEYGSRDNTVNGNVFSDISATAVQIGDVKEDDYRPTDPRTKIVNHTISNNYIRQAGAEYRGGVGIWAGYTENTAIVHNELHDLPYTGISIGWGWGGTDNPPWEVAARNNRIANNLLCDFMKVLWDGGGIYSVAAQPGERIEENVLFGMAGREGAIYLDNKSRGVTIERNVLFDNGSGKHVHLNDNFGESWLNRNFWDATGAVDRPVENTLSYNFTVSDIRQLPASVLNDAGLESAYRDLHPRPAASDTTAPSVPGGLSAASRSEDGIALSWTASTDNAGVTGYEIYRDGKLTGVSVSNAYTEEGLEPDTAYVFQVRARDEAANLSGWSAPLAVRTEARPVGEADNLALNKPASAYYMDNSPAVMQPGSSADLAVDGNSTTKAQATNQYLWQLEVDLGVAQQINRVKIEMETGTYASQFDVRTSVNGTDFTTAKTVTGFSGGIGDYSFSTRNARYVRIVAVKPDGAGQAGGQMAISELGVYRNLAMNAAATALYMDGTPAIMQPGSSAALAVDDSRSTKAQATGQYRWQLQLDLGAQVVFNRLKTYMETGTYATAFDIAVSSDGSSFSTIKSVAGFGGGWYDAYVEPVSARYVRVIAIAPDGPGQPGGQMAINDVQLYLDRALSVTTLSDTGVDAYSNKYRYQTISTRGFTFQAGDVVEYDVKLPTRNGGIGGLDMTVVDGSVFRDLSGWKDQFGISGHPAAFPAPFAQGKWTTRKLAVPSSMAGKTVVRWDIGVENDYRQTELSAMYDNIVVRRNGRVVMVVYDGGNPHVNSLHYQNQISGYGSTVVNH